MKAIRLPSGRCVPVGTYAKAWRKLRDMDPKTPVAGWDHFPTTAGEILREMSRGLMDRIHRNEPRLTSEQEDEFWRMRRLANVLNGTRVVVGLHEIPPRYRAQLAHRVRAD